jgi:hypothetical protein
LPICRYPTVVTRGSPHLLMSTVEEPMRGVVCTGDRQIELMDFPDPTSGSQRSRRRNEGLRDVRRSPSISPAKIGRRGDRRAAGQSELGRQVVFRQPDRVPAALAAGSRMHTVSRAEGQHHARFHRDPAPDRCGCFSPLRSDSRQLVSKIWWRRSASNAIMDAPEWLEPAGFVFSVPAYCGNIWADVDRQIIQIAPYGRGRRASEIACLVPARPA